MNLPSPLAANNSEAAAPAYDYELKLNPLTRALYFFLQVQMFNYFGTAKTTTELNYKALAAPSLPQHY